MARKPEKDARERILDAALEIFADEGFAGTTTREIAAHAGTISYELLCAVSQRVPLTLV